eukprot:TRINITY_DN3012_c0_g2_i1.p2 TRINITY_DN3012_c0_g2~~TRINITY_DN3012_c0_g2_i1.p2  ORF type:complete len:548 (+),score=241.51 TRINITY_DN3012_c0_g2_i1:31-1644(+)
MSLVLRSPSGCNHVHVCTALYRVAKLTDGGALAPPDDALLSRLMAVAEELLQEDRFTARHLSNLAVALARLGDPSSPLLPEIARAFAAKAASASVGELAMVLWAYATLQRREPALFDAVAQALLPRVADMATKELCTAAWALSTADHYNQALMEALAGAFKAQAAGAARAGGGVRALPQDLSMLAWAFSHMSDSRWTLQPCAVELLQQAIEPQVLATLRRFRPPDLAQLATAMARLSYDSEALLRGICRASLLQLDAFSSRELNALLLAMAKLDFSDEELLRELPRHVNRQLAARKFTRQELVNMAWSMAVLDVVDAQLLNAILTTVQGMGPLPDRELHQVHQVCLVFAERVPEAFRGVDGALLQSARDAWRAEKRREKQSSARHLDVSKCLALMGVEHRNESEHDIDIEVVGVGLRLMSSDTDNNEDGSAQQASPSEDDHVPLRVAIEVDGPGHFTCNSRRSLGHTVLKHRILAQLGWTVVQVPFYHWDRIPFWASMERKRYLQRKLGITRTIHFGARDWSTYRPIGAGQKSTRFD